MSKRVVLLASALFGFVMAFAQDAFPQPGPNDALVRFVHLVPDGPKIDISAGSKKIFEELAYKDTATYLPVAAGEPSFVVSEVAKTDDKGNPQPGAKLLELKAKLEKGRRYTIALLGSAKQPKAQVFDDAFKAVQGQALVRVVQASADVPAVDVAVKGGPLLFKGLAYGQGSAYTPVRAMIYDLEVRPAGKAEVVLSLPGISLQAGRVYTVFVVGNAADTTLEAVFAEDNYGE
ncbi:MULTISPECIES: DUF4397 domain-containing protein [unclassified Meiothermus]|uniref:DUF4397 domain-containing protein n=1 Tax=unclassified Meiothermus TaxID=370471 RepID=UPI000D7BCC2A|nr:MULTISPECIES: DUF4397 domain-containing protein [unclassified Meiothermus]PZA08748.1 DUF4397 domain-containing protein [Meiothermus sp. Pnk-1]RYM40631.1 DUF4397 domain-containing protein [Meiothermus sp. PNK-Is4]